MTFVRAAPRWLLSIILLLLLSLAAIRAAAWLRENDANVPAQLQFVRTPLGRVAVDVRGSPARPLVLIVPGTAGWSGFWSQVSAHLASRGYRVIAVDLPPFGYSDHDPLARYDRRSQAERLSAILKAIGGRPAAVVAHSFGGGPATELSLIHPEQVSRLILVDGALGALDPDRPGKAGLLGMPIVAQPLIAATLTNPHMIGALSRSMLARKDAAAAWRDTLRQPMRRPGTTAAYAAWLPFLLTADDGAASRHSAALRQIRVPVRLIWGEADPVTPIGQGLRLARLFHAPIARLPGVGHVPHVEDPAHFLPALDAALSEPKR